MYKNFCETNLAHFNVCKMSEDLVCCELFGTWHDGMWREEMERRKNKCKPDTTSQPKLNGWCDPLDDSIIERILAS